MVQEPGSGVRARVDGREVAVGSRAWACRHGAAAHGRESAEGPAWREEGSPGAWEVAAPGAHASATRVWVAVDGRLAGVLELADAVRPDAAAAVAALQRAGMRVMIVSGASLCLHYNVFVTNRRSCRHAGSSPLHHISARPALHVVKGKGRDACTAFI